MRKIIKNIEMIASVSFTAGLAQDSLKKKVMDAKKMKKPHGASLGPAV